MHPSANSDSPLSSWIEILEQQVKSLRFGIVQIVVHDQRVVQIERTEKFRLSPPEKTNLTGAGSDDVR
jgi:hypothetical protein